MVIRMLFDAIDKLSNRETNVNIDLEDVGVKILGRSFTFTWKMSIGFAPLKPVK